MGTMNSDLSLVHIKSVRLRSNLNRTYPNVPWPIFANFSNFVAASQNGKLYSSKYFSLSRAIFICNRLGDGVDGGVKTPFKFVMAAVLRSVRGTCGLNENRRGHTTGRRSAGRLGRTAWEVYGQRQKEKKNRTTSKND